MAEYTPDTNPTQVIQNPNTITKDPREVPADATLAVEVRVRPADLRLIRSLSKSDSDLLASPVGEEDGGLAGRSGSVSDCSAGQPSIERMPSFASEWDEVITPGLWGTRGRVCRMEGAAQALKPSVLMSLTERV